MEALIKRQTSLTGNIVMFCRYLRSNGYTITSSEEADAMKSLEIISPLSEYRYWSVLRAVLSKSKYQFEHFENHYKDYQYQLKKAVDSKTKNVQSDKSKPVKAKLPSLNALKSWLYNKPDQEEMNLSSFSDVEVLSKKDFAAMNADEIKLVLNVLQQLTQKILRRKSRTRKFSKKKKSVDLRMTIRKNLRAGTDIQEVVYSVLKDKRLKLVLLCDVSRSMDLYSRFFIQMIYAFHKGSDHIETFVFSTALHQVTEVLANHDYDQAFELISDRVPQWSGGTKIGSCLDDFYQNYNHKLLDRKTVVLILSDGWDTGETAIMSEAMKSIYKSSRKVLWLNPLAGHPSFEPEVIGLKTVMPYIHKHLAAHNLESLKEVLRSL